MAHREGHSPGLVGRHGGVLHERDRDELLGAVGHSLLRGSVRHFVGISGLDLVRCLHWQRGRWPGVGQTVRQVPPEAFPLSGIVHVAGCWHGRTYLHVSPNLGERAPVLHHRVRGDHQRRAVHGALVLAIHGHGEDDLIGWWRHEHAVPRKPHHLAASGRHCVGRTERRCRGTKRQRLPGGPACVPCVRRCWGVPGTVPQDRGPAWVRQGSTLHGVYSLQANGFQRQQCRRRCGARSRPTALQRSTQLRVIRHRGGHSVWRPSRGVDGVAGAFQV
mmetsp:Transcript_29930/g.61809  ORF Transcript_29930/g.61809 Transcript_29930/m.61809 type:complete len:275 (-) Transcript_29930:84-908(-)